jgi:hypothetical protein
MQTKSDLLIERKLNLIRGFEDGKLLQAFSLPFTFVIRAFADMPCDRLSITFFRIRPVFASEALEMLFALVLLHFPIGIQSKFYRGSQLVLRR